MTAPEPDDASARAAAQRARRALQSRRIEIPRRAFRPKPRHPANEAEGPAPRRRRSRQTVTAFALLVIATALGSLLLLASTLH